MHLAARSACVTFDNVDLTTIINYNDAKERWVSDFDSPLNVVLGVYYQQTDRFFDQDVIFAFLPIPGCDVGTATVCGPEFTGALADPDDQFTAYNKISETDGETWSVYAQFAFVTSNAGGSETYG